MKKARMKLNEKDSQISFTYWIEEELTSESQFGLLFESNEQSAICWLSSGSLDSAKNGLANGFDSFDSTGGA